MPKLHDRVLPLLCGLGVGAVLFSSFLSLAPNRLADGVGLPLWRVPFPEVASVAAGLAALGAMAFLPRDLPRSIATVLAAALILGGSLAGAGDLARALAPQEPPAARFSLGPAFWVLAAVALLALLDAAQRARATLWQRASVGALFCLGFALMAASGAFADLGLAKEFANNREAFLGQLGRHLFLVATSVALAFAFGAPLTAFVQRKAEARGFIFSGLGLLQTIPSIALFGILIAPLSALSQRLPFLRDVGISGAGAAPAIIALTLYSLGPLVRGFHRGLAEVAPEAKDAAKGIGFDPRRMFFEVELPLASPALISALRVVTIQAIGLAAVAALIGAGGLGAFVFAGIGQYALDLVLVGALPIILLALAADFLFQMLLAAARRRL